MPKNACNIDSILFALGLIVYLLLGFQIVRYEWIDKKRNLDSKSLVLFGLMSWALLTVSCSLLALGSYGWDQVQCAPSEFANPIFVVFCPSIIALLFTLLTMSIFWTQRIRLKAKGFSKRHNP